MEETSVLTAVETDGSANTSRCPTTITEVKTDAAMWTCLSLLKRADIFCVCSSSQPLGAGRKTFKLKGSKLKV